MKKRNIIKRMLKVISSRNSDFLLLSKNQTFSKISELIDSGYDIICDLHDRDGKIGLRIIGLDNNFEEDICLVMLEDDVEHELEDRFLYNLIYNTNKKIYYLEEQDEYFEKISVKND